MSAAILRAARARLADPSAWAPGAWAQTASGPSHRPLSSLARRWSLLGALRVEAYRLTGEDWSDAFSEAHRTLEAAYGVAVPALLQRWERTVAHADALAMLDRAIAIADGERQSA